MKIFSCQVPWNFESNKSLFSKFGLILTKLWVFIPRNLQKNFCLVQYKVCKFPLNSCLKRLDFLSRKIQPLWNHLRKFQKRAHYEILSLRRAFKWSKNQIIFKKFKLWPTSLFQIKLAFGGSIFIHNDNFVSVYW